MLDGRWHDAAMPDGRVVAGVTEQQEWQRSSGHQSSIAIEVVQKEMHVRIVSLFTIVLHGEFVVLESGVEW